MLALALPLPEKRMLLAVDTAQLLQAAVKHLKANQRSMTLYRMYGAQQLFLLNICDCNLYLGLGRNVCILPGLAW